MVEVWNVKSNLQVVGHFDINYIYLYCLYLFELSFHYPYMDTDMGYCLECPLLQFHRSGQLKKYFYQSYQMLLRYLKFQGLS